MSDDVPTSGGVPLTPATLAAAAAAAEAGYDLRQLRPRGVRGAPYGPMPAELGRLVHATAGVARGPLLLLSALHSWLIAEAARHGMPPTETPLQEWAQAMQELFTLDVRMAAPLLAAQDTRATVSSVLAAARPAERRAAQRTLVAMGTVLSGVAMELADQFAEIEHTNPKWPLLPEWTQTYSEALRHVADTARRFTRACESGLLEDVLVELVDSASAIR